MTEPIPVSKPDDQQYYSDRVKRAAHLLFFKHGRIPGSKAWELKTGLGKEYLRVLGQLDEQLKDLDLEIKKVEEQIPTDYPTTMEQRQDESRFFVRLRGTLTPKEARMTGWRLDNLAALTACLSLIISKQGKSDRKEVEQIIGEKVGRWRALTLTDVFLRSGYLEEDEQGLLKLGWRTRAEIDLQKLMTLVAESQSPSEAVQPENLDLSESETELSEDEPLSQDAKSEGFGSSNISEQE